MHREYVKQGRVYYSMTKKAYALLVETVRRDNRVPDLALLGARVLEFPPRGEVRNVEDLLKGEG